MHVSFNGILFGGKIASYLLAGEWRTRLGGASTHCLEAQQAFSKSIPENVWTEEQNQKWRPDFCTDSVNWKALRIIEIQGDRILTEWQSENRLNCCMYLLWSVESAVNGRSVENKTSGSGLTGRIGVVHNTSFTSMQSIRFFFWSTSALKWGKKQKRWSRNSAWHLSHMYIYIHNVGPPSYKLVYKPH